MAKDSKWLVKSVEVRWLVRSTLMIYMSSPSMSPRSSHLSIVYNMKPIPDKEYETLALVLRPL